MTVGFADPASANPLGDDLYREIILDHYRSPRHHGDVAAPSGRVEALNPLCGDQVTLTWRIEADRVEAIAFTGKGCSICMASSSLMCEGISGCSVADVVDLAHRFKAMLVNGATADGLGDLEALGGVAAYPVRIKCAVLPWNALLQELDPGEGGS